MPREPIFQGFGVHEFLVIGSAALATLVGLIVVAWLLVQLTGAHRDYVQLQPRPATGGLDPTRRTDGGLSSTGGTPRRPRPKISPSTWVGVGFVFVLAVGAASWIAFQDDDDTVSAPARRRPPGSPAILQRRPRDDGRHRFRPVAPSPPSPPRFCRTGFDNQLAPGFGAATRRRTPAARFTGRGPTA